MVYNLLCENDFPNFVTCFFPVFAFFTPGNSYIVKISEDDHPRMMKHSHAPAIFDGLRYCFSFVKGLA
jgi:hypothetical protein